MIYNTNPETRELVLQAVKKNGNDLMKYQKFNSDREIVIAAIRQNGNGLFYAGVELRNDREVVRESMKVNQHTFYYMSDELKKDRSLALEAVKEIPGSIRYAPGEIKNDRSFIVEAALLNGKVLQFLDGEFLKDREIVENAVSQYGYAIKYAPEEFQRDESLMLGVIRKALSLDSTVEVSDDLILKYVKEHNGGYLAIKLERCCNVKEVILGALENNGSRLNENNKREREFILDMLKENWEIFEKADENIKNEKQVYTKAFGLNCTFLEDSYNSELFNEILNYRKKILDSSPVGKIDKEIASKIVHQNFNILKEWNITRLDDQIHEYLHHFSSDRDFVLQAVYLDEKYLSFASDSLKDDFDFMVTIAQHTRNMRDASPRLKSDPQFILRALDYLYELKAPKELRADRDFMMKAVQKGTHLYHASDDLKNDKELVLTAIKGSYSNISHASKGLQKDREFIIEVLKIDGNCLKYLSKSFKNDRELILTAAQSINPYIDYELCYELFPTDREVMMECTKQYGYEMIPYNSYLSDEFRFDKEFMFQIAASNNSATLDVFDIFGNDKDLIMRLALVYGLVQKFDEDIYRKRIELVFNGVKLPTDKY
ncbi:predicted protein [Naegleria gruberi]|uniref:Predicted protein n=1 Tax=Naegleria gruberi TaxID=5762 RepID=D2VTT6_NAEGR|nr:uncharacterized protein NAEGRDRAFT_52196 [Naegleria gruberi]EFC39709.1 predicted protein [Naegleria gruberi]|eukprot:XP_002672453.1 predicted protein [Naegleria gruberi strain NEG-M]